MHLSNTPQWPELLAHHKTMTDRHLTDLFAEDPQRFSHFSLKAAGIFLDYSKNRLTQTTLQLLTDLATSRQLPTAIEAMFSGQAINLSEKRPVLHTALRDPNPAPLWVADINIRLGIQQSLAEMSQWIAELSSGQWTGYSGKAITDIIHLGIGGSHLGPLLAQQALSDYDLQRFRCHYISSIDHCQLDQLLNILNPETTLVIIASKSFGTQETAVNTERVKQWFLLQTSKDNLANHFVATTANPQKAQAAGIAAHRIIPFWDWVGGRYSLWSSVGLPLALSIGMENFQQLLAGAHAMDEHFRHSPFLVNMPVILGLIGFWYSNFFQAETQAILPYDYQLRSLPRYLQQLDMESNGKRVDRHGNSLHYPTAPITFGETGTESQHSFHQLLFQGSHLIPCDFIATLKNQPLLLANCFAQSQALMTGKSTAQVIAELISMPMSEAEISQLARQKTIPGNQPSNTLLIPELTPHSLGALLALYEHKTFVQGVLWDINSFDQWGVELGKEIAKSVLNAFDQPAMANHFDSSTRGLLQYAQQHIK